ncbi:MULTISPECIES: hypothetical protein [Paraburkholderia]|jgi:hypothetical protein|uniref:Uncharacterized protein n=1 Tax=Paraburkholderia hospita TaxID=169430 RepID=A0AAN1MIN5_9BURK|nr:hypothetical protein [Paraburkholderia hospita]AUT68542.1 hypothetical protein C2L64_09550 [Paraburkholderia hospita]SEI28025.1 hypothetical protein SAMN05192544_110434 [Paraburkholderia hospita]
MQQRPGDPEKINAKFKVTGKKFPASTEYESNQKWIGQRMRADARMERQMIVLDSLSAAFHAMVSTGRAAA